MHDILSLISFGIFGKQLIIHTLIINLHIIILSAKNVQVF